jgi:uncharacterized protein (TIGR00255 family)
MVYSMTGFARVEIRKDWGELVWEVRSVNHRYLESFFRMPEELRIFETKCRDLAGKKLKRGKLDCQLRFKKQLTETQSMLLDEELAKQVVRLCHEVENFLPHSASLDALNILRWPGVVKEPELEMDSLGQAVLESFEQALKELSAMRSGEGERLKEMLLQRCVSIGTIVQQVRANRPAVVEAIREKLNARLQELVEKPDMDRLEQELVMQAQKLDVDEELDRLESHVAEVREVLERGEPVGRRLDFLMQEFNREANTLGSKSSHVETTRASVDLKVLIEQMREQVQNIE